MAKTVTVSVTEEIHKRMMRFKSELNFSKIFREAIECEFGRLEKWTSLKKRRFQKMEAVIERLREEKQGFEENWFDTGKEDAMG